MHTRFEHSLGVMHMVSLLYDGIVQRSSDVLKYALGYNDDGLSRNRQLVRIAALLHDVGHAPFSHAAEELFPTRVDGRGRYRHEDYSAAIMRRCFADTIKNHPLNSNYGFTIDDVANLIEGSADAGRALFWRDLIVGQMDADRIDYLLRDSLHAGVDSGLFDWRRLLHTVVALPTGDGLQLGVTEGGWHAAEGLILARYFMFCTFGELIDVKRPRL
jgi:HD superfamily phosphohydrolase